MTETSSPLSLYIVSLKISENLRMYSHIVQVYSKTRVEWTSLWFLHLSTISSHAQK